MSNRKLVKVNMNVKKTMQKAKLKPKPTAISKHYSTE